MKWVIESASVSVSYQVASHPYVLSVHLHLGRTPSLTASRPAGRL